MSQWNNNKTRQQTNKRTRTRTRTSQQTKNNSNNKTSPLTGAVSVVIRPMTSVNSGIIGYRGTTTRRETEESRGSYNESLKVFPEAWTRVLLSLDHTVGLWNIRSENLGRWYIGQEPHLRITEENGKTEFAMPDNIVRYFGALSNLQREQKHKSAMSIAKLFLTLVTEFFTFT
ncbi:hypothetical protein TorRG33x02_358200 [Trema orientale]|uniref:Uncharacterized protein n=1 Tax=Trema orientale TaxID=63057 RepID=A0A2P5A444_TREOI|nr:hypothetical protein TorRG33x02_358200 [Trema orientale]